MKSGKRALKRARAAAGAAAAVGESELRSSWLTAQFSTIGTAAMTLFQDRGSSSALNGARRSTESAGEGGVVGEETVAEAEVQDRGRERRKREEGEEGGDDSDDGHTTSRDRSRRVVQL